MTCAFFLKIAILQEMSIDWSEVQMRVLNLGTEDSLIIDLKDILTAPKMSSLQLCCGDMDFSNMNQVDKEIVEGRDMHICLETTCERFPSLREEWLQHLGFRVDPPSPTLYSAATYQSAKNQPPEVFWRFNLESHH